MDTEDSDVAHVCDLAEIRRLAEQRMPDDVRTFVQCTDTGNALRANERAWERWALRPRVLVDVSRCDTSTTVVGERVELPVLVAPFTLSALCHPDGELAPARACADAGTIMTLSCGATRPPEEIGPAAGGRFWMHLEASPDRGYMKEIVDRATAAGATALCFTVSRPIFPLWSAAMMDALARLPWQPFIGENPLIAGKSRTSLIRESRRSFTWADLERLRELSPLPLVLKGIQTGEDAALAADHGAAAVIVSNHGGFMVDEALGTAQLLADVVEAAGDRVEVLVDGGIRSGADVLRALALGARAALIGRPALWGLTVDGARGCGRVLELMREQLEVLMAMTGARRIPEIDRTFIDLRM